MSPIRLLLFSISQGRATVPTSTGGVGARSSIHSIILEHLASAGNKREGVGARLPWRGIILEQYGNALQQPEHVWWGWAIVSTSTGNKRGVRARWYHFNKFYFSFFFSGIKFCCERECMPRIFRYYHFCDKGSVSSSPLALFAGWLRATEPSRNLQLLSHCILDSLLAGGACDFFLESFFIFGIGSSPLQNTHILLLFLLPVVWVDSISIGENSGSFYFYKHVVIVCNCIFYDIDYSWGQV